jgi:hypothetical protein
MNAKPIKVSREQVSAARALIQLRGGVDRVDPIIAKVAQASPRADQKPAKAS